VAAANAGCAAEVRTVPAENTVAAVPNNCSMDSRRVADRTEEEEEEDNVAAGEKADDAVAKYTMKAKEVFILNVLHVIPYRSTVEIIK